MSDLTNLQLLCDDSVATIVLDDPPYNRLGMAMFDALDTCMDTVANTIGSVGMCSNSQIEVICFFPQRC